MDKEFFDAVAAIQKERNIQSDAIYDKIANAIVIAAGHMNGSKEGVFCDIDPEERTVRVYARKTVVPLDEDVMDGAIEICMDEAQKYKSGAVTGDVVEVDLEFEDFGRIAAQTVKHVLRQGIREIENDQLLKELQSKNNEIVSATVKKIEADGKLSLTIGKTEAILPRKEQIPDEVFEVGDVIQVYFVEVKSTEKGPKAIISRTHPGFVRRLFENEVSEIFDGIVEIHAVSREAGSRTKIAVSSKDPDIDPVGACIGQRGMRVNRIVSVLRGEKIDIVKYSDDPAEFIAAALAPAEIVDVKIVSESPKSCEVKVPDTQLSLAIGNKGQNVRLAAKLTGWKIDINPESGFYQHVDQ